MSGLVYYGGERRRRHGLVGTLISETRASWYTYKEQGLVGTHIREQGLIGTRREDRDSGYTYRGNRGLDEHV